MQPAIHGVLALAKVSRLFRIFQPIHRLLEEVLEKFRTHADKALIFVAPKYDLFVFLSSISHFPCTLLIYSLTNFA